MPAVSEDLNSELFSELADRKGRGDAAGARAVADEIARANLGLLYGTLDRLRRRGDDEAESRAGEGLARAIHGFDPGLGWKFSTYATTAMERMVLRRRKLGSPEIRASDVGGDWEPADDAAVAIDHRDARDATPLADELRDLIEQADMPEDSRLVIRLRYLEEPSQTLGQIGELLGVSKEWVRQLEAAGLRSLRREWRRLNG